MSYSLVKAQGEEKQGVKYVYSFGLLWVKGGFKTVNIKINNTEKAHHINISWNFEPSQP